MNNEKASNEASGTAKARKKMTRVLRELLDAPGLIQHPGVHDALTAKMVEQAGFRLVGLGGGALGAVLGVAEPCLHLEDMVRTARYITGLVDIPVKVDCGAGFGEPLHVRRTVREIEDAGAAACQIEDQIYPKRAHYHKDVEHIISPEEMISKIRVAAAARRDPDFVIIARTDSMYTDGYVEGIRRANLYLEAGADLVQVSPRTMDEARSAPKEIFGRVAYACAAVNTKGYPSLSRTDLEEFGYKLASYPSVALFAGVVAMHGLLTTLRENGHLGEGTVFAEGKRIVQKCLDLDAMYALERQTVEFG